MVSDGIRQNPNTHCQSHNKLNNATGYTSDKVAQWIRARLVWGRTRVQPTTSWIFFLSIHFSKNMLVNIIILILFMGI
jgi:hypothetical protein